MVIILGPFIVFMEDVFMKLFEEFEAIKFSQENLLFVAKNGFLYYI